jgi:quinol monooxygenase YgiN
MHKTLIFSLNDVIKEQWGCTLVTEIAIFHALAGKEDELGQAIKQGQVAIRSHPDCLSAQVERCIEDPAQYICTYTWTSREAHTVSFRNGPLFQEWRRHIDGLFEGAPIVFHYQAF